MHPRRTATPAGQDPRRWPVRGSAARAPSGTGGTRHAPSGARREAGGPDGSEGRRLHLAARLDDDVHRVFQLAVLGLVRRDSPSMAAVEDVRLALDEVLLAQAIVEHPRVELDVLSAPGHCRLEVVVHLTDLRVDTAALAGLVDDVDVVAGQDRTLVRLHRRWPVPDGPGPPARAATS